MKKYLFLALSTAAQIGFSQNVIKRGPYLNTATQTGIKVLFRTAEPCLAQVNVTLENGEITPFTANETSDSNHVVLIDGLQPGKTYPYQCLCNDVALTDNSDSSFYFRTLPSDDYAGPINIWAIGDFGEGSPEQKQVKNAYQAYMKANNWNTDVWLMLGDNAYGDGTDEEYQTKNFEIYPDLYRNTTAWPAPGNHDYKSVDIITHNGPYYDIYDLPKEGQSGGLASGTEFYYSFDVGNTHFVCLNSEWTPYIYAPIASPMALWLIADMQQSKKTWKVAFWHQPPYTKGSHDSDDPFSIMATFRQNILPFLELGGCDIALQGHSHCYERSFLLSGHYGYSQLFNEKRHVVDGSSGKISEGTPYYKAKSGLNANKGTVYNVVGNSGKVSESGTMDHPVMYYSDNVTLGSAAIRIHGDTLTSRYISNVGDVLDEYTIIKTEDGKPGNTVDIIEKENNDNIQLRLLNLYGKVWLSFELYTPEVCELKIINSEGKTVAIILPKSHINVGKRMYEIPSDLENGNYIGVLETSHGRLSNVFNYSK
tara:strand:- start:47097 stop:48710 length:1614 start_codon:yes stop_codon:yes gene_type:complete